MATKTLTGVLITTSTNPIDRELGLFPGKVSSVKDHPLTRSLIEEFGLHRRHLQPVDSKTTSQLGGTLLKRAETIYVQAKCVRNLASNITENPARFGCTVVSLMTGLASLYSGDLVTGGFATFVGAKELYNQCSDGNTSSLQQMLNDINADVEMVKALEEGQQKSFQVIDENLVLIRGDVQTLYDKLDQIKDLNTESLRSLEGAKRQAYEKGMEAKEAYRDALRLFTEAKQAFGSSKGTYDKCAQYFKLIKQIATDESDEIPILEKVNSLVQVAESANKECQEGKGKLDEADGKFGQAMEALSNAMGLKDQAIEMISRTVQSAQDTLKHGAEKAVYTKECTQRIEATQKELQEIKDRSDDVMRLLNEMSDDVKRAKTEAAKKLDPSDVVVGVGTGILFAPLGTFSALAVGVTAAYAWHNGTTIADTTKKVYNYFFGIPLPPPDPMAQDEYMRVHLNEKSSGYYGWLKGRSSFTFGYVDINLGSEIMQIPFNLNQKDYPICKEDLFTLYNKMFEKLGNKTLSPERCKEILQQLQTVTLDRGGMNPNVKGLIRERQAAFGLVKALHQFCDKLSAKEMA